MIDGPGYSQHYPDVRESGYLTWALAQTPLNQMQEATASLDRIHDHLKLVGIALHGDRLNPFTETIALGMLGVDAAELESRIGAKDEKAAPENRVLMFGQTGHGDIYSSLGDVLGSSGYSVTVASPDLRNTQRQEYASPGITYLRKSMGQLDASDADPGFRLAIISNSSGSRMDKSEVIRRPDEEKLIFSPQEKLRGLLRVIQPAGRLVISNTVAVQYIRGVVAEGDRLADEISSSYDMAYLRAYAFNRGTPHKVEPLLILERRAK